MSIRIGRDVAMVALGLALGAGSAAVASRAPQTPARTFVSPNGATELKVLLDKENFGADLDVGEMTMPAGLDSGEHAHQATEIFYVLSGELEHVVNGESELLKPGMAGFVRPPDKVRHRVPGGAPVKTLVIWTPGGEAGRITARWKPKD